MNLILIMNHSKLLIASILLIVSIYTANSQNARLHVEGSFATVVTTVTTDNLTLDETHQVVLVNSVDSRTITLPSAVGISGRKYTIKKIGNGNVNISTQLSQTIDGAGSFIVFGANSFLSIVSDGSNWWVVGRD